MDKRILWALGGTAAIGLVVAVFLIGRVTASPSPASTEATATTTQVAPSTSTTQASTTTASEPLAIGDATAVAGEDQMVSVTSQVTLDGSESTDPDEQELEYSWTQTYGPDVTGGSGVLTGTSPNFAAPETVSTLVFELIVADGEPSNPDSVMVHVLEDAFTAVFVDPNAEVTGVGRGTMDEPFNTIAAGIAIAQDRGGVDIYLRRIEGGDYVFEQTLEVPANVSFYGGYGPDWIRDVSQPTTISTSRVGMSITIEGLYTVISGVSITANHPSRLVVAVDAFTDDVDGGMLRIEDSTLVGGDSGRASYGLIAAGVFDVSIARSQISSGNAGAGRDGSDGGPEDVGARGGVTQTGATAAAVTTRVGTAEVRSLVRGRTGSAARHP